MSFSYDQPFIVTGSIIERDGKILLVKENHPPDKGKWNLPAGKLDYGEDPTKAAVREVKEETGLIFVPENIVSFHSVVRNDLPDPINHFHVLRVVYSGSASGELTNEHGEVRDDELEISEYGWFYPEEIFEMEESKLRFHDIKLFVKKWKSGKNYPLNLIQHLTQS